VIEIFGGIYVNKLIIIPATSGHMAAYHFACGK